MRAYRKDLHPSPHHHKMRLGRMRLRPEISPEEVTMFELTLWKDQEMKKLRQDMDRLFDRMWSGFGFSGLPAEFAEVPRLEMSEAGDALTLEAKLQGMDPEDIEISVTTDSLTISGRKTEESRDKSGERGRVERRYGSFSRTMRLPCKVKAEEVEASYGNGILKIVLPKSRPEQPRGVRVKVKK